MRTSTKEKLAMVHLPEEVYADLMETAKVQKTPAGLSMSFREFSEIVDSPDFKVVCYQRPYEGKARNDSRYGILGTIMTYAYALYEGKLEVTYDVLKGTELEGHIPKEDNKPHGVTIEGSPIILIIKDGKIIGICEGEARAFLVHDVRRGLVRFPKKSKNPRDSKIVEMLGGRLFTDFTQEMQDYILDNIYFEFIAVSADDKFERYLFEIVNNGSKPSVVDKVNAQAANVSVLYDAAKAAIKKVCSPESAGQGITRYDREMDGLHKQASIIEKSFLNYVTRFFLRDAETWGTAETLVKAAYQSTYAGDATQARKDAEWAVNCILHAIHVLNMPEYKKKKNYNPSCFVHLVTGVAMMLNDLVYAKTPEDRTVRTMNAMLSVISQDLRDANFSSKMREILIAGGNNRSILNVCCMFTSNDFILDKPRCVCSYKEAKEHETDQQFATYYASLPEILGATSHSKKATDFVRRYLGLKVMEMCDIPYGMDDRTEVLE